MRAPGPVFADSGSALGGRPSPEHRAHVVGVLLAARVLSGSGSWSGKCGLCHGFLELPDGGAVGGDEGPRGVTRQMLGEPVGTRLKLRVVAMQRRAHSQLG